jgi:hypothetical protein
MGTIGPVRRKSEQISPGMKRTECYMPKLKLAITRSLVPGFVGLAFSVGPSGIQQWKGQESALLRYGLDLQILSFGEERALMRDFIFVICTIGFFVAAIVYVCGCERLK